MAKKMMRIAGKTDEDKATAISVTEQGEVKISSDIQYLSHADTVLEPEERVSLGKKGKTNLHNLDALIPIERKWKGLIVFDLHDSEVDIDDFEIELIQVTPVGDAGNLTKRLISTSISDYPSEELSAGIYTNYMYEIPLVGSHLAIRIKNVSNETKKIDGVSFKLL